MQEIEEILNEIAFKEKQIKEEEYEKIYDTILKEIKRAGRYKRTLRRIIIENSYSFGLGLRLKDVEAMEVDPYYIKERIEIWRGDYVKKAFVDLISAFFAAQLYYNRVINVAEKVMNFQRKKIEKLEREKRKYEDDLK